jgi:hypothetical protein
MALDSKWRKRLMVLGMIALVGGGALGLFAWYKFFREVDEPTFASLEERYKYGSIGAESKAGLPYWIWVALPRVFPDYVPGSGGYRAFGVAWEEGHEMPIGFTKKTIGFPRVANNCAICHTTSYKVTPDDKPRFVPSGPGGTNIQALLRFFSRCANDSRFNADTLLAEIKQHAPLSFIDRLIYRYVLIPRTRQALVDRDGQFAWMNRAHIPDWGPGRDDPMNLTKYFMTKVPVDNSVGQADFPSTWNLSIREGKMLNWAGETPSPRSVILDSALGLQAKPDSHFQHHVDWIQQFLRQKQPPKFPFPVDERLAGRGKNIFDAQCNSCHGLGPGTKVGTVIDIAEIGTDRERLDTWTKVAADAANKAVADLGIHRVGLTKTNGYQAVPLDGIWLRGPYLHNGSVPNLSDLLEPADKRTKVFYRGYDLIDPVHVGFDSECPEAQRTGFRVDTAERGNGNGGHNYGTNLPRPDKQALVEYLKTL